MQHRSRARRATLAALCLTATAAVTLTACGGDKDGSSPWDAVKESADSQSGKDGKDGKGSEDDGDGGEKSGGGPKGPFPGMSGPDIVEKSVTATSAAKSLSLKGSAPDDEGGAIDMDIALNTRGECAGSMSMKDQGSVDLIVNRSTVYMRPDAEFIRSETKDQPEDETAAAVQLMADRWSKSSATSSDAKGMATFCDLDLILAEFKDVNSAARRGEQTSVDGTPALALHETEGKDKYTIYVATEGKPYLLKIVNNTEKRSESLTFGDYDKPVDTTAPSGDVLDLDKMN
ncbi:hypothetical protein [Streptomyces alboflavus]|uniref:hypothetical protein n=1 Tax=Streptomyces alboflavus TaxID=67267 RepID=UPI0004BEB15A|nr:hypothetical protein [Streptomyces alboflavus]